LLGVPTGRVDQADPQTAIFPGANPHVISQALASPLVVLASTHSTLDRPDGTGAFRATLGRSELALVRNLRAAQGPSFLRKITVQSAPDLKASLRTFEAERANLGWLGAGLYRPRAGAVPFDCGNAGWIVLRTGKQAGAWDAPGVGQQLLDGIEPTRLGHLGLGWLPPAASAVQWGGPRCKLVAPARSAHLAEVASALASILSRPGREVELSTVAAEEFANRRTTRDYALMVDVVRPLGPAGTATLLSLVSADDPVRAGMMAAQPPTVASFDPRVLARTLRLGVVGGLRVAGAVAPSVVVPVADTGAGWDLGAAYVRR
jgi:peptide/nickel transport system substrate-binding protein